MPTDVATIARHPALDLIGTVAERTSTRLEHLTSPGDLGSWLTRAGVCDRPPPVSAADLTAAVALREALYAVFVAATAAERRALPRAALSVVNAAAAAPPATLCLTQRGEIRRDGDIAAALSSIARSALELLGGPDLAKVRWCADDACTHLYLDRSRAGRRRWCGMSGCGDRAKAKAYRERQRR